MTFIDDDPMPKSSDSATTRTNRKRRGQVLGAVVPALLMAAGSIALAAFQITAMTKPIPPPEVTAPAPPPVVMASPIEEMPVAPEPPEPKPPAVSAEELSAMEAEARRLEIAAAGVSSREGDAGRELIDTIAAWKEARREAVSSVRTTETATLEMQAAAARAAALSKSHREVAAEIARIAAAPKPPREALSGVSPVAKPAKGQEYHFEVSGDRIAFIDLQALLELVKKDFQVRMRLSGSPRGIQSEVGPVGDFGLAYEVGMMNDVLGGGGSTGLGLRGWEVVPARDPRGETVERAAQPLSEFDRAVKRLSPSNATITMWVYPDGFGTFRVMRDRLHALGFMVAARPLPQGVPVRGSPMGSISAGQ
jgi:hypothetical protein